MVPGMVRIATLTLCSLLLAAGCAKPKPTDAPFCGTDVVEDGERRERSDDFFTTASAILDDELAARPLRAVTLGLHKYDGRLRDVSAAGLADDATRLKIALEQLRSVDPSELEPRARVERATLITTLDGELFELEVLRAPWRNPMFYVTGLELTPYISRDYAPVQQRAAAVSAAARAGVAHLEHARANLEDYLPRTFVETALLQVRGTISFVEVDVPAALPGLAAADQDELDAALAELAAALREYEAFLVERQRGATDEFALGAEGLVEMLARREGIELSIDELQQMAEADLARNLAAAEEAAAELAPGKPLAEVMATIAADKPAPDQVLAEAARQAAETRQFLLDHALVSIPTEDVVEVVETPAFMRWNIAFLDGAGPFETASLPSFYYISPPDPAWPEDQQRAYVPNRWDLLFITIHEVWPGHFLHGLHLRVNQSHILQALWIFTTGEGWAHYGEQMMWEQGLSDDPRVRLGQLQNALLRDVRFVSALGLHTGRMSVDESAALFETMAFQDGVSARQQAVRGTFDPMYLGYTLGKLLILDLRDAWLARRRAAGFDDSLRLFHDELLSYGAAPLPAVREAMLSTGRGE